MQIISAALLCAACSGGGYTAPAPLATIALPSGSALEPYDAGDVPLAKPEGMALTSDGRAWVLLTNLDQGYAVAGPAQLAGVVPATGATTLIDLGAAGSPDGGSDDRGCTNAGTVKSDNGLLIAACTGSYGADARGRAIVQVDPANHALVHTLSTNGVYGSAPGSFQPGAIAGGPSKIWVGDTNSATLISVARSSFALADGADAAHPPIALPCTDASDMYLYVSDLLADGNDLFALCSGDPDGYLVQLDATTGAVKGTPQLVGATPLAMALLGDGRIAVINSIDETLAVATRGSSGPTVKRAVYTFAQSAALQDVKARGQFAYVVASGTNTVVKLDLSQSDPAKLLVGEVNTGDNSYPWAILPLDDNQALVSANGLGALLGVKFAGVAGAADAGSP